jgi:hypothetical protein
MGSVAPRGTPVPHTDLCLEREAWDAAEHPSVEILGLEACLPLLGAI